MQGSYSFVAMTPDKIEAALQASFNRCDSLFCPLSEQQKQILLQVIFEELAGNSPGKPLTDAADTNSSNPLDDLTQEQRQALLQFVKQQDTQNQPWQITLLNDWLNNRNSGSVQFVREEYGIQWLNRIQPVHLAEYDEDGDNEGLQLKVGDRIEVSNSLWEWVQEEGPCSREWVSCTVIGLYESAESNPSYTRCLIRFSSGVEYEIQGIYEWNRYNWRWAK